MSSSGYGANAKYFCDACRLYIQMAQTSRREHENTNRHKENARKHTEILRVKSEKKKHDEDSTMKELKRMEMAAMHKLNEDYLAKTKNAPQRPIDPNAPVFIPGIKDVSTSEFDYKALRQYYQTPEYKEYYEKNFAQKKEDEGASPELIARLREKKAKELGVAVSDLYNPEQAEVNEEEVDQIEGDKEIPEWKKEYLRDKNRRDITYEGLMPTWETVPEEEEVFNEKVVAENEPNQEGDFEKQKDDESDSDSEEEFSVEKKKELFKASNRAEDDSDEEPVTFKRKPLPTNNKKNFRRKTTSEDT